MDLLGFQNPPSGQTTSCRSQALKVWQNESSSKRCLPLESRPVMIWCGPMEARTAYKAVRIGVWIMRFLHNLQNSSSKTKGPLTTAELEKCLMFLVKRTQLQGMSHAQFDQDHEQQNMQRLMKRVSWNVEDGSRASTQYTCLTQLC